MLAMRIKAPEPVHVVKWDQQTVLGASYKQELHTDKEFSPHPHTPRLLPH